MEASVIEHLFRGVPGVSEAISGYSGGFVENPSYQLVCTDTTGHAEVVQVTFDPEVVSYDQLLEVFWAMHDPTQVNRQGPDRGSQYRSIVLTTRTSSGRRRKHPEIGSSLGTNAPSRRRSSRSWPSIRRRTITSATT